MCNNSQGTHYIPEGRWQLNMFNDYKNTIDKLLLQLFRPTVTIKRTVNMPITYALLAGECTSLCICTYMYVYMHINNFLFVYIVHKVYNLQQQHVHTSGVGCSSVCSTWEMC